MQDLFYIGLTIVVFAVLWLLVRGGHPADQDQTVLDGSVRGRERVSPQVAAGREPSARGNPAADDAGTASR